MTADALTFTIPARVKSRTSPLTFGGTSRFIVEQPKTEAEIAEHDRRWLDFIDRKLATVTP